MKFKIFLLLINIPFFCSINSMQMQITESMHLPLELIKPGNFNRSEVLKNNLWISGILGGGMQLNSVEEIKAKSDIAELITLIQSKNTFAYAGDIRVEWQTPRYQGYKPTFKIFINGVSQSTLFIQFNSNIFSLSNSGEYFIIYNPDTKKINFYQLVETEKGSPYVAVPSGLKQPFSGTESPPSGRQSPNSGKNSPSLERQYEFLQLPKTRTSSGTRMMPGPRTKYVFQKIDSEVKVEQNLDVRNLAINSQGNKVIAADEKGNIILYEKINNLWTKKFETKVLNDKEKIGFIRFKGESDFRIIALDQSSNYYIYNFSINDLKKYSDDQIFLLYKLNELEKDKKVDETSNKTKNQIIDFVLKNFDEKIQKNIFNKFKYLEKIIENRLRILQLLRTLNSQLNNPDNPEIISFIKINKDFLIKQIKENFNEDVQKDIFSSYSFLN